VDALSDAILRAVEQRDRLPAIGRAARQVAEARADWEKNFQQMLVVYRMVQKSRNS
jgi:glycosyltransferase involved in cell wall biosynthesis